MADFPIRHSKLWRIEIIQHADERRTGKSLNEYQFSSRVATSQLKELRVMENWYEFKDFPVLKWCRHVVLPILLLQNSVKMASQIHCERTENIAQRTLYCNMLDWFIHSSWMVMAEQNTSYGLILRQDTCSCDVEPWKRVYGGRNLSKISRKWFSKNSCWHEKKFMPTWKKNSWHEKKSCHEIADAQPHWCAKATESFICNRNPWKKLQIQGIIFPGKFPGKWILDGKFPVSREAENPGNLQTLAATEQK